LKVIHGKFGEDAPTGKDKVQQALKKFEESGINIDECGFTLIVDTGGDMKVASDLEIDKLIFMLEVIKLSVLTGSYEV
jgi:hypothetical protein